MTRRNFLKLALAFGATTAIPAKTIEALVDGLSDEYIAEQKEFNPKTFNELLKEYLPIELLAEELKKRDYVLNMIEKDHSWKGAANIVPFNKRKGLFS